MTHDELYLRIFHCRLIQRQRMAVFQHRLIRRCLPHMDSNRLIILLRQPIKRLHDRIGDIEMVIARIELDPHAGWTAQIGFDQLHLFFHGLRIKNEPIQPNAIPQEIRVIMRFRLQRPIAHDNTVFNAARFIRLCQMRRCILMPGGPGQCVKARPVTKMQMCINNLHRYPSFS